jgi:hypothetical protein
VQEGRLTGIERMLARSARALSGGELHPLAIAQSVEAAALASVRDRVIANRYAVAFHRQDYERYEAAFDDLREFLDEMLAGIESGNGYERVGDRLVSFSVADVAPGNVTVDASFADTDHRGAPAATPLAPGRTRRIVRHEGKDLVFATGDRVRLSHTPFTIGRAPGNDLVLLGMAISRNHAQIQVVNGEFVVHDLGSRNGLLVDGVRVDAATLNARRPVVVGDVPLWLVEAP